MKITGMVMVKMKTRTVRAAVGTHLEVARRTEARMRAGAPSLRSLLKTKRLKTRERGRSKSLGIQMCSEN